MALEGRRKVNDSSATEDNDEDLTKDLEDDIIRYRVQHLHKSSVTIA